MSNNKASFVISLDFELYWGVKDHRSTGDYGKNILGVRQAVPQLLQLFRKYDIHATWATVGFLFHADKKTLLNQFPSELPSYEKNTFSNYKEIETIGENEEQDPYHFGASLIKQIVAVPHQEIATHTYSHYYCLEKGQTLSQFKADLQKAIEVAQEQGIDIRSIIFPRNQYGEEHLKICKELGIEVYRGNPEFSVYKPSSRENESFMKRVLRVADTYLPLSGSLIHKISPAAFSLPVNVPASRFLRPYSRKLSFLEGLKIYRIQREMYHAARQNKMYHLWWHPHNFGSDTEKNIQTLQYILEYYKILKEEFGMKSLTMYEASKLQ